MNVQEWWRSGPDRLRRRRRLLVFSAPVAVLLVIAIVKLATVGWAGRSAESDFSARNADALRGDVTTLDVLNVVEPAKAFFAAGALAVLEGRLPDADAQFSQALSLTDPLQSCPTRVNLELVRETLGDQAAAVFDGKAAVGHYLDAVKVVTEAPGGCFAGNADADEQRRVLRDGAARRLEDKIAAVRALPPPPPPPPPVAATTPPPVAGGGSPPPDRDTSLRLNPGREDPVRDLQRILRDVAAARGGTR